MNNIKIVMSRNKIRSSIISIYLFFVLTESKNTSVLTFFLYCSIKYNDNSLYIFYFSVYLDFFILSCFIYIYCKIKIKNLNIS